MHGERMIEFINIYKSEPCLWKVKSKDYYNKAKRDAAYDKLVAKLKESHPAANKEMVVKKIGSFRGCYRKELKKLQEASKYENKVYEPQLWYFNLLTFLNDQDLSKDSTKAPSESNNAVAPMESNCVSPAKLKQFFINKTIFGTFFSKF